MEKSLHSHFTEKNLVFQSFKNMVIVALKLLLKLLKSLAEKVHTV